MVFLSKVQLSTVPISVEFFLQVDHIFSTTYHNRQRISPTVPFLYRTFSAVVFSTAPVSPPPRKFVFCVRGRIFLVLSCKKPIFERFGRRGQRAHLTTFHPDGIDRQNTKKKLRRERMTGSSTTQRGTRQPYHATVLLQGSVW